jgi:ATP-dependent DNA helicase RecG
MKIEELHRQAESQRLEFKESFGKDTVETVAALCNATGGIILIGVDKKGNVKGVGVTEEIMKDWINVIKQATQPQIFPEISPVLIDGKTIVSIMVQEYPIKPVS